MKIGIHALLLGIGLALAHTPASAQQPEGMEPGPPHETHLEIGSPPPTTPALTSVTDGELYDLAAQRGRQPILLHFFRGTW